MNHIRIYHSIWSLQLSFNAFRTYCALLRFMNTSAHYANVSMRKLAAAVGLSEKSVSRGIAELERKKLITVVIKHHSGHRLANGYRIRPQEGGYTKLPFHALAAPVTASGFKLYAYLLKCMDKNKRAFPSLTNIAHTIGATVKTVAAQVKELIANKLLNKRRQIKRNGSFGHNQYRISDQIHAPGVRKPEAPQKEKTRLARVSLPVAAEATNYRKSSLSLNRIFVKGFFALLSFMRTFLRGVL